MPVETVDIGLVFDALDLREALRIDSWSGDHDHSQIRNSSFRGWICLDNLADQRLANTGSTNRDDADPLVFFVAKFFSQLFPSPESRRVEPGDVTGEVIVVFGPLPDHRQVGPKCPIDDVFGVPDKNRFVPDPLVPGNLGDHLGVVIGGNERFTLAP